MNLSEKLSSDKLNYQSFAPSLVKSRWSDIFFRKDEVDQLLGYTNLFKLLNVEKHKINDKSIGFLKFKDKDIFFEQDERGTSWHVVVAGDKKEYGMEMLTGYSAKWISEFTLEIIDQIKLNQEVTKKPKMK